VAAGTAADVVDSAVKRVSAETNPVTLNKSAAIKNCLFIKIILSYSENK
jgi:hypothetical protein